MGNKKNILLAEDDEDDFRFFLIALKELREPVNIFRVRDGEELMELLAKAPLPDVLFLDINMPRKNGFECLTEIRASEAYRELPVVIFSTTSIETVVNKMYDAGANAYIVKPFEFEKWMPLIQKAVDTDWKRKKPDVSLQEFVLEE